MGKKKIVLPLILACVVAAIAVPYGLGVFDDDTTTDAEPDTGEGAASADEEEAAASTRTDDSSQAAGSSSEELIVDDLVQATDPGSPHSQMIRDRLDPLTGAAGGDVEPFQTPEATTLYQATLAHPAHSQADLHYVASLQPLPEDLDRALAEVVLAHGVSTAQLSQPNPPPGASLTASVTMATALDQAMPVLERYIDHPIWDSPPAHASEATSEDVTVEAPALPEALMGLYASLGYGQDTLETLEPQVQQATADLGPEESRALAQLVTAQTEAQHASADVLSFMATPASHPEGPAQDGTRTVEDQLTGTPLEDLTVATQQLRAAAQQAHEILHQGEDEGPEDPGEQAPEEDLPDEQVPDEAVREEPWVDPLGLIVVGTRGNDTFDARHGGQPDELALVNGPIEDARSTVGETEANLTETETVPTIDGPKDEAASGEAGADAANGSTVPEPGWHMLVLDPGGDDVYRNNAGGIDAGNVLVRANVDARDAKEGADTLLLRGDRACAPGVGICEPQAAGVPSPGQTLQGIQAQGPAADVGQLSTGLPLTAAVVDVGGDDSYKDTGPVIQGAARGVGVGMLADAGGDDRYEATELAQGAAEEYGIGLLLDRDGNDTYEAEQRAQGWVDVPGPEAEFTLTTSGLTASETVDVMLARMTQGSLVDTGGHDEHALEDLFTGQGMVQIQDGAVRKAAEQYGYQVEHGSAQLVDVGGDERLPVPARQIQGQTVEMRPSQINVSEESAAHFWLTRRTPETGDDEEPSSAFAGSQGVARYKTAVHADPGATPNPVSDDALRAGSVEIDCKEGSQPTFGLVFTGGTPTIFSPQGSGNGVGLAENAACSFGDLAETPPLLLFGEPDRVQDPPALTLTFGGDTHYNGSIASVNPLDEDGEDSDQQGGFFLSAAGTVVPRTLLDLEGDDTYEGRNDTIGHAANIGTAMVIDRSGDDTMIAGNRSVAHASRPSTSVASAVAAVIDLDGDLTVRSDEASQGYASEFQHEPKYDGVTDGDQGRAFNDVLRTFPPMALLDAGAQADTPEEPTNATGEATEPELPTGSLDLKAGNASQGYSEGIGVAIVVGSPGPDRYEVDGWGQGVHDQMQSLARFCEFGNQGDVDTGGGTVDAGEGVRALDPWLGGLGLVLDPDGDDTYLVDSGVGLGDAQTDSSSCSEGSMSNAIGGSANLNFLGMGTVLDVRGQDDYTITDTPPRPDEFPERYCSGANRTECQPADDKAWTAIDEEPLTDVTAAGIYQTPAAMGLGVDNVRNAHHLAAAACRDYNADAQGQGAIAGSIQAGDCDRIIREEIFAGALDGVVDVDELPTRQLSLEVALPSEDADIELASGQTSGTDDQVADERLPIPTDVTVPENPEPLFLGDAARPQCEDRESASEVTSRGQPDLACISLTRDVDLGQWITNDPVADRLDPGDTVACNCSVRLQVQADQNSSDVNLRTLDQLGLYPDRGRVSTFTDQTGTWYDAFNRFRVPLTADDPIQDGRLRGDFVEAEAAADFPMNLSQMPTGLAQVEATAIVEDTTSEESGGLVEARVETWSRTLIHERSFQQAHVSEIDGESIVFLEADGPVDPDRQPTITVDASDEIADELTSQGWEQTDEDTFTRTLPRASPIDGPSDYGRIVPQEGASACAAILTEVENDGEGVCWTGDSFVVGLPLGEIPTSTLDSVHAGDELVPTQPLAMGDSDAEPRFALGTVEDERVQLSKDGERVDVYGLPGTELLDAGQERVTSIVEDRPEENWLEVTVEPKEGDAVGIAPLSLLDSGTENFDHKEIHHAITDNPTEHPHVELWTATKPQTAITDDDDGLQAAKDGPVLIEGEPLHEPHRHVLHCADLSYASFQEVRDVMLNEVGADVDTDENDKPQLKDRTCLTYQQGDELRYLVPITDYTGTQVLRIENQLLRTDGELVTHELTGHVDPQGVRGEVAVQPTASKTPKTNVTMQMFPQTADEPRLDRGDNDLDDLGLEVRGPDTNWTAIEEPFDEMPTILRPQVQTQLDLSAFVDEDANASTVELRGSFIDESNNTITSEPREFILDRAAPNVTSARIVTGAGQSQLVLNVDEAVADVRCVDEGCPLEANATVPDAQPEPFLDTERMDIGPREISIPILDLQRGPTYEVGLEIVDTLGNEGVHNLTVDTFTPLSVDASPLEGTLVNKTITLNWTAETQGSQTLSTFSSAYLMLPEGPCPVLQANPNVVPADEPQTNEKGPLSVEGQTGERSCTVPEDGVDAELIVYALAPSVDALALDSVPVFVDTTDPTVKLDTPEGWVNETTTVTATSNDSLDTDLEMFVDQQARDIDGANGTVTVTGEGSHDVLARATDEAGNTALNQTTVRIDRTDPSVTAEVLGVRGGLALVNATAEDDLSGVQDVQLVTSSTSGPRVPEVGGQSVLLSVPVETDEDELVVRVRDQADNVQDLRLSIEDVPRVESGPLVTDMELTTPAPDTLQASFETTNRTTPVVIVDAGDRHVEEALDPGRQHELTLDELPPGEAADVTVTLPRGADLVPALNATAPLPADTQPPTELASVSAEPVEGGVELTWEPAEDDVGVREVLIHRDGAEIARTAGTSYVDEPPTFQEHTYQVAAVDQAGNRGPWTEVAAEPIPTFRITELTTSPDTLTPDEPVQIEATVQTPAGLSPDVVTVAVGEEKLPMKLVDESPYSSTYRVDTRLPTLNVAAEDTDLAVTAKAGDRSETKRFPAPVVSSVGPAGTDSDEVPGPGVPAAIAALGLLALARRRWCI